MSEFIARPNVETIQLAGGLNMRSVGKIRRPLAQNHPQRSARHWNTII